MHPCLSVPEIFALICDCFTSTTDPYDRYELECYRKTLKSLTLCQRSFYDTALATLWKDQKLTSLLRCLPPDIFKDRNKAHDFVVVRQITPQDLERSTFYATLIRRISTLYLPMDRSCLDALRDVYSQPLLPNLRFLRLGTSYEAAPDHIRSIFLSPGLRRLELHLPANDEAMPIVPCLHESCPDIQEFALWIEFNRDERMEDVGIASSLVRHWNNLRTFRVPHVNADDLPYLASLPRLSMLGLDDCRGDTASIPSLPSPAFIALQVLTMHLERIEYGIALLRALLPQSLRLRDLRLGWDEARQSDWPALLAAIACSCHHASLALLELCDRGRSLSMDSADEYLPWPGALSFAAIQPLTSFSNLVDMSFVCPRSYVLADGDLCRLAEAWPHLERLNLRTDSNLNSRRPQYMTIHALVDVARLCPRLKELGLDFDASMDAPDVDKDERDDQSPSGAPQHPLCWMNVGYSRISSAPPVANLLSSIFPALSGIMWRRNTRAQGHGGDERLQEVARAQKWKEVTVELQLSASEF
ncbi:hypothetical protein EV715DRAFT_199325 [Schizophyllum commune]